MPPRSPSALLRLLLLVCALGLVSPALTAAGSAAATAPAASTQQSPRPDPNRPAQAQAALDRVERILSGVGPASSQGHAPDLTLALRDLFVLKDALSGADRQRAERILARPTDNPNNCNDVTCYPTGATVETVCSASVCVHFVRKSEDSTNGVPTEDDGAGGVFPGTVNGTPDYVDFALAEVTDVHDTYVAAGYRAPIGDGVKGGDAKPDIYLAQIGDQGLYGYCQPEALAAPSSKAASGYCVLDNDYRPAEFPFNTPAENLQVTAAHEYFHDVQFAYDVFEDAWLMEATATWAEDEVYDGVNDNRFYLRYGPIKHPETPLDTFAGLYHYGAWIFFRHLTEQYTAQVGGLPVLVRDIWELLDGYDNTKPDKYSIQAVKKVIGMHNSTLPKQFASFASYNRMPKTWYEEGGAYPKAPLSGKVKPTKASPYEKTTFKLDHLASGTYRYVPDDEMRSGWKLRLKFEINTEARGGFVVIAVKEEGEPIVYKRIAADDKGRIVRKVAFNSRKIQWVEATVVNASTRYNCWEGTNYSCEGRSKDDNRTQVIVSKAVH